MAWGGLCLRFHLKRSKFGTIFLIHGRSLNIIFLNFFKRGHFLNPRKMSKKFRFLQQNLFFCVRMMLIFCTVVHWGLYKGTIVPNFLRFGENLKHKATYSILPCLCNALKQLNVCYVLIPREALFYNVCKCTVVLVPQNN